MLVPEALILTILRDGLEQLGQDPGGLLDLFDQESGLDVSRLQSVLNASPKKINVILGFPQAGVKETTIGLTLGSSEELEQFLGSDYRGDQVGAIGREEVFYESEYSSMFQSHWRITVYSVNADLAIHLSYLVKYLLLVTRTDLEREGLLEQRLAMADFEPIPQYLPDIVYVRAVMLSAKVRDSFTVSGVTTTVSDVEVLEE